MASTHSTPITPQKQLTSNRFQLDIESIDCTPDTRERLRSQKRKASEILEEGSPQTTIPFLKWRLAVVEDTLNVKALEKKALSEATEYFEKTNRSKSELLATIKEVERGLTSERAILLSQRKSFEGDLNDVDTSNTRLEDAYITELRYSLELASSTKEKAPGTKAPRLEGKQFAEIVHKYLGTGLREPNETAMKFCNVLGFWLPSIKCARIIPFSFHIKEMGHMFGSDESPLTSRRNGLSLQAKIEEAFDNCWVTIVPRGSVASTPTEWKIILLNPNVRDWVFYQDTYKFTDRPMWKWRDIDGRKLTFCNDNRPARRFLYMRYTLAWLHAEDKGWEGFKEKVPPGHIWASPNKPDGYLRSSILRELGRRTGDTLPEDLITAGAFDDAATSSVVYDTVAGIRVTETVQRHLEGERDPIEGEDSDEEDEEEDE
ncbi:MAG: hypothetical protein Q9161_009147 [Pseudevernia consocians]